MRLLHALSLFLIAIPQRVLLLRHRANSPQNTLFKGATQFKAGRLRQNQGKARRTCQAARSRTLTLIVLRYPRFKSDSLCSLAVYLQKLTYVFTRLYYSVLYKAEENWRQDFSSRFARSKWQLLYKIPHSGLCGILMDAPWRNEQDEAHEENLKELIIY